MAALRQFAEPAHDHAQPSAPASAPPKQAPRLANAMIEPRPSPARMLQDELRRALSPGPIIEDRYSLRRAMKFIAPTWLGLWGFIALVGHIGHH